MNEPDEEKNQEKEANEKAAADALMKAKADAETDGFKRYMKADEESGAGEGQPPEGQDALANIEARLSRIEEMLDLLVQEEDEEGSTDAKLKGEQPPGADAATPASNPKPDEKLAQLEKDVTAKFDAKLVELEAKFAKIAGTGTKHTNQSGIKGQESEDLAYVRSLNLI
ncbi:MAG: hypothetical protein M0R66_01270 [Candidatus Omnitrophica bacterium]|nr:hypothetical protein [Candidatus Omnitrophota bacterium]